MVVSLKLYLSFCAEYITKWLCKFETALPPHKCSGNQLFIISNVFVLVSYTTLT